MMINQLIIPLVILLLATVMTMTGRGGGNFYVLVLVLAGLPMHEAALTGQFILFISAATSALVFRQGKTLSVPLALVLGAVTAIASFTGGSTALFFSGKTMKLIFAISLSIAGLSMMIPSREKNFTSRKGFGFWKIGHGRESYVVNLWIGIPAALLTGFFSGMVGVSGGSFLVPIMVLAFGLPVHIAAGTASAIVASTALAGFCGHILHTPLDPSWALYLAAAALIGGFVGGNLALKSRPAFLKTLFALTTLAAAVFMYANAVIS
jgi:hypothetical protein